MNQLQIFKNNRFGEIRVATTENNEPLFCLADICKILDLQTGATKNRLNEGGISTINTPTSSGNQNMIFVDESNFYKAVFQSRKTEAEAFTEWVTSEVLPSIRKHGAYMNAPIIEQALTDPDTIIRLATNLKEERRQKELLDQQAKNLMQQVQQKDERILLQDHVMKQNAPKIEYYNEVLQSESAYTTTQVAKELGMAAPTLNRKLNDLRVQYKQNGTWVLYEKYQNKGYTKTKTHTYTDNGVQKTAMQTTWTEKGRLFIHSLSTVKQQVI
jgi:prophage antirepressor-like protein